MRTQGVDGLEVEGVLGGGQDVKAKEGVLGASKTEVHVIMESHAEFGKFYLLPCSPFPA